jgi:hypothetical protein
MSTVYCVSEVHPQHVDVVANRKTASLEYGCLETDMYFAINSVGEIYRYEVFRGPRLG